MVLAGGAVAVMTQLRAIWTVAAGLALVLAMPGGGVSAGSNPSQPGAVDPSFNLTFKGIGNGVVDSVVLQPDGKILVGGSFTEFDGTPDNGHGLMRLNSDGSRDSSFAPTGTGLTGTTTVAVRVSSVVLQPDGKIVVGGSFTGYDGTAAMGLVRLNPDGSRDTSFHPVGDGLDDPSVHVVAVQSDGKILAGGWFHEYDGTPIANHLLRLNPDGSRDSTFHARTGNLANGFDFGVFALAVQPDGKIVVGGDFQYFDEQFAPRLLRLNPDGSRDPTFTQPGEGLDGPVDAVLLQPDGKILACGLFVSYNGVDAPYLIRLNPDGSRDTSFAQSGTGFYQGNMSNSVEALALQPDGKILAGGRFVSYNGVDAPYLIRLNPDGSRDPAFVQTGDGLDAWVHSVTLQPDGKILAGGGFLYYNERQYTQVIRLLGSPGPAVPTRPRALKIKATMKAVKARWKAASGATNYTVKLTGRNPKDRKVIKTRKTSRTSTTIKVRLKRKSKVSVCVRAANAAGTSSKSCRASRVVQSRPTGGP